MTNIRKDQPTGAETHVDTPLTNMSVAYLQNPNKYIFGKVFPTLAVNKLSGIYFQYDPKEFLADRAQKRAAGAAAVRSGYNITQGTYDLQRDAIGHQIPDPIARNADNPLNLDRDGVTWVTQQLMTALEADFVSSFMAASVWSNTFTPALKFNDPNSDVITEVKDECRTVEGNTGFRPNVLVAGALTHDRICEHPDIIDRLKYGQTAGSPAMANENKLAQLFEVDRYLVARAVKNSAAEGVTGSYGFMAGSDDLLGVYAPATVGLQSITAGVTLTWAGTGNGMGMAFKRYRDEPFESDIIEGEVWYQHKVVAAALGFYGADVAD